MMGWVVVGIVIGIGLGHILLLKWMDPIFGFLDRTVGRMLDRIMG